MRLITHGENLIQLTRLPHAFPVNCYLVREADGFTLIDAGLPGSARAILAAAAKFGVPIARIALTHAHLDHVGSLDKLREALPSAEILISTRDARFLAGDRSLDPDETPKKLKGSWKTCKTRPTQLLRAGDRVGSLEVVPAPGHTPGQVAFLDTRDRSLIAGDAFQTQGGVAVAGVVRPLFPFPAMGTWSRALALESAQNLLALKPSRLVIGHGRVLESPGDAMARAIAIARRSFGKAA